MSEINDNAIQHLREFITDNLTLTSEEYDKIYKEKRMTKSDLENEIKYLKQCCSEAGLELQKYSYEYDYKEKNLVIQAQKCNEIISELKKKI